MLLIKNIGQIVTLRGAPAPRSGAAMSELGIIENGAILIRAERILWVGPTRELPRHEIDPYCEIVDCVGLDLVALPGFVDSHTHPVFAGTRANEYQMRSQGKTYQEIAAGGGGIRASVRQLRAATQEQLEDRAERYFLEFLAHGTTTIEAKSGYGLSLEDEIKSLQVLASLHSRSRLEIVPTFLGAHDVPDELRGDARRIPPQDCRRDDPQGGPRRAWRNSATYFATPAISRSRNRAPSSRRPAGPGSRSACTPSSWRTAAARSLPRN